MLVIVMVEVAHRSLLDSMGVMGLFATPNRTIVTPLSTTREQSFDIGDGYHGYSPSRPIYRPPINGYGHIHRQEGRRYINDYPCAPVVVVPAIHHRHYQGCGCRY